MKYRIEYANSKCCKIVENRKDLLKVLETSKPDSIADVRKIFKNGSTDSVFESYKRYLTH